MVVLILSTLAVYSLDEGRAGIIDSVGTDSIHIANFIASALDREVYAKYHELLIQARDSGIQQAIDESNAEYDDLDDPYSYADAIDSDWQSVPLSELSPLMQEILASDASGILMSLREHYIYEHGLDVYAWIAVANSYGAVVGMSGRTESFSYHDEAWWSDAVANGSYFGEIVTDPVTGVVGLLEAAALTDDIGNFIGTIFAVVDIISVALEAVYLGEVYETTEMRIVTADGRLVYVDGGFDMLQDVSEREFFERATEPSGYFIVDENRHEKLFSYTHATGYFQYDGNGLVVFLAVRTAEVLSTVVELNQRVMIAFVVLIGASIAVAMVFTGSISSRIRKLATAADGFSKGDLSKKVDVGGSDEVAQLAAHLNDMAMELDELYKGLEARVQERTNELEQATRKLRLLGSITRHDGLNQVAIISAWISILEETATDDKGREILGRMKEAAGSLEKYLTFTGTYEQIGVERPTWIDMDAAMAAGLFGIDLSGVEMQRDLTGVEVYADPMLPRVLRNLVENSQRHGGGVTRMSFSYQETAEGLLISYQDDGKGVPPEMKAGIFERPVKSGRRSFGLYLSREILSITGATITETGEAGKGARFEIMFPVGKYRISGNRDFASAEAR
ncbi:MAG: sensor histidine kinase [Thermoplasmata archaeon]|nr:sensor histidine kinase [Thermoplasmata archaeon]